MKIKLLFTVICVTLFLSACSGGKTYKGNFQRVDNNSKPVPMSVTFSQEDDNHATLKFKGSGTELLEDCNFGPTLEKFSQPYWSPNSCTLKNGDILSLMGKVEIVDKTLKLKIYSEKTASAEKGTATFEFEGTE